MLSPEFFQPTLTRRKEDFFAERSDSEVYRTSLLGEKYVLHVYPYASLEQIQSYQYFTDVLRQALLAAPIKKTIKLGHKVTLLYRDIAPIRRVSQIGVSPLRRDIVAAWKPFIAGPTIHDMYDSRDNNFEASLVDLEVSEQQRLRKMRKIFLKHNCPRGICLAAHYEVSQRLEKLVQGQFSPTIIDWNCKWRSPDANRCEVIITDSACDLSTIKQNRQ